MKIYIKDYNPSVQQWHVMIDAGGRTCYAMMESKELKHMAHGGYVTLGSNVSHEDTIRYTYLIGEHGGLNYV